MAELDTVDRLLVELLQRDARMPQAALAKRVGLAASSVNERIRKLEQQGFIAGYHARLSAEAMGYDLLAFVYVAWSNPKTEAKFLARVADEAAIIEIHHVTGVWNYMLKVRVRNSWSTASIKSDSRHGTSMRSGRSTMPTCQVVST